ncbi:hypothetical protein GEMRC1_008331 [Eukaryota sp. GEM-RC1]
MNLGDISGTTDTHLYAQVPLVNSSVTKTEATEQVGIILEQYLIHARNLLSKYNPPTMQDSTLELYADLLLDHVRKEIITELINQVTVLHSVSPLLSVFEPTIRGSIPKSPTSNFLLSLTHLNSFSVTQPLSFLPIHFGHLAVLTSKGDRLLLHQGEIVSMTKGGSN